MTTYRDNPFCEIPENKKSFDYKKAFYILMILIAGTIMVFSIVKLNKISYNSGVTDTQNQTYNYLVQIYPTCTPVSIPYIYENKSINLNFYSEYCIKQGSNGQ